MNNIKIVAFDFGGVLGSDSDDFDGHLKSFKLASGLENPKLVEIFNETWPEMVVGKKSTGYFYERVSHFSSEKDIVKLHTSYSQAIYIDRNVESIVKLVKKKDYKVVILSNAAKEWMDVKRKRFDLDNLFDKIYASAYLKMKKPDKNIYEYVLNNLGINGGELLFIDNLEENTRSANETGINTILYSNAEKLMQELKSKKIL